VYNRYTGFSDSSFISGHSKAFKKVHKNFEACNTYFCENNQFLFSESHTQHTLTPHTHTHTHNTHIHTHTQHTHTTHTHTQPIASLQCKYTGHIKKIKSQKPQWSTHISVLLHTFHQLSSDLHYFTFLFSKSVLQVLDLLVGLSQVSTGSC